MGNSSDKPIQSESKSAQTTTAVASDASYKIVFLGAAASGKSALINQYVSQVFISEYEPTIEESYSKQAEFSGRSVTLSILDSSGHESYTVMLDSWLRVGQGFVIVYSVNNRESFYKCPEIYNQIVTYKDTEHVPIVFVGNKSDMADREVSTAEGEELAKKYGLPFIETSAMHNLNVDQVFREVVKLVEKTTRSVTVKK